VTFFSSAEKGHLNVVETLIKYGANKEAKEKSKGASPLYIGNYLNKFF
jgi:hypothetical protein